MMRTLKNFDLVQYCLYYYYLYIIKYLNMKGARKDLSIITDIDEDTGKKS